MKCPDCFSKSVILESRLSGQSKRRRHECCNDECKLRFTTYELVVGPGAPAAVKDYLKHVASRKPRPHHKVEQLLLFRG
jgi:transcriptional regulator NrdR family protein